MSKTQKTTKRGTTGCGSQKRAPAKDTKALRASAGRRGSRAATRQPGTKTAQILALLRRPAGATLKTIMAATGWQQHSVRGFLAGVVRKKLGLNLVSESGDSGRVYRIVDDQALPAKADRVKQAA